jgi:hypothetical protein
VETRETADDFALAEICAADDANFGILADEFPGGQHVERDAVVLAPGERLEKIGLLASLLGGVSALSALGRGRRRRRHGHFVRRGQSTRRGRDLLASFEEFEKRNTFETREKSYYRNDY